MAFDAFLKIDGIPGESTDDSHQGWIEIESFAFGTDQIYSAADSTNGCITVDHLELSKLSDQATSKLREYCAYGKHAREATLEVRRSGNKQKCLEVKMNNVIVAAYRSHAHKQPNDPSEEVELSFAKVKWTCPQPVGANDAPVVSLAGGWDVAANKVYA